MKHVFNSLNQLYYLIYTLIILMTISGYFLNMNSLLTISVDESTAYSLLIIHGIVSILALVYYVYFFVNKGKFKSIENTKVREIKFLNSGKIRLFLIGISLFIGVIALYLVRSDIPLYFLAVSGLLLLISKPVEVKIEEILSDN